MAKLAKRRLGPRADSENLSGLDPISRSMVRRGIPLTRENWLLSAGWDPDKAEPSPEEASPGSTAWSTPR